MTQKTLTNNSRPSAKSDTKPISTQEFLNVLYPNTPENLWFELRCIHPKTGEVRTLWTQLHDESHTQMLLKNITKINQKGYGVYFAPRLRNDKQGNAKSASLLPALWIDIDCGSDKQRVVGLQRLQTFEPKPSAIINSGGGWHAYWLLEEPIQLDNSCKQKIARILQGLFAALGGDEGYVKSVASVMRLPGSINTKPERNSAKVEVIEWHPERRYAISEFDWLEVKPSAKNDYNGKVTIIDGHAPLPPRTERYLISGASNGNRNAELFAAACQMRDAGYSQSDAEGQLVARHVADGNGNENASARGKEAQKTIASVYSQSAREPLTMRKAQAQQKVSELVTQYAPDAKQDRPTTAQIVAAVEACVNLNPVEWAEQREQFKALTGNGLKISDIDRLYKEKKREVERQQAKEFVDDESYVQLDGKMIYRKENFRGVMEKTVADWSAQALFQTCQVDDDGKETHVTTIELRRGIDCRQLEIPGDVFVDDLALRRFIGARAGAKYVVRAGMTKHLVPAIIELSGDFPTHRHYNFMGWKQIDERWVYVSPEDCITTGGKLAEPPSVELDNRLRDYGVKAISLEDSLQAFFALTKVLSEEQAPALIAFAMLPLVQKFLPNSATRPAVHLVGTSGSGKSEIAALLSSFYGEFSRDAPPAQWGDTINSVEALGYPLADALFWVDDYKDIYADERTFTRFLQSYSRGMGRGRLTREAKMYQTKPCRGLILSTGETTMQGEMSVLSRMLCFNIAPWHQRDPEGTALDQANDLRGNLPGFTAHFASWIAKQLHADSLPSLLAERFKHHLNNYAHRRKAQAGQKADHDRMLKNWATLATVYDVLKQFLSEQWADGLLPEWQDCLEETMQVVREERASEVFLNVLGQLLASGEVILDDNRLNPLEPSPGTTIVGYRDDDFIHLLPDVAYKMVTKYQDLKFSTTAIGMQLKEGGWLLTGTGRHLTVKVQVRGSSTRMWRLRANVFDEVE